MCACPVKRCGIAAKLFKWRDAMLSAVKAALIAVSTSLFAATACYGQVRAVESGTPEAAQAIERFIEREKNDQARAKKLVAAGGDLFGGNKRKFDTTNSPLPKVPDEITVGDWGRTGSFSFRVVQKVDDALLIVSTRNAYFWLQGLDVSKAAEGMEFALPLVVVIPGTKTYTTIDGGTKTVLVMECDEQKVSDFIATVRKKDEEAGWRTWTLTKQAKGSSVKNKRRPLIIRGDTIEAKIVKAKGGKVTLQVRTSSDRDGIMMDFLAKEFSDADRKFIREHAAGRTTKSGPSPTLAATASRSQVASELVANETAVPGATDEAIDRADERDRWFNESYNSTLRRVKGNAWQHIDNKTGQVLWNGKETASTSEYIELLSERNEQLRVMAKRMELYKDGKWGWVANGHWEAAPNADHDASATSSSETSDPSNDDSRDRWINKTYNTTVRYVKGRKVWEEVDNKTGRVNWVDKEIARTADYIELFSPERKSEIRLRAERMEQKLDGEWKWVANGQWGTTPE